MKIAMPINDESIESGVCISFGRAPFFLIYDTESKDSLFLKNAAASSPGGAGILAAQYIVDNKADVLITPRCGENAVGVFNAAATKIYKTNNDSIEDNIKAFNENELELLVEIHSGFHNHGGN